MRFPLLVAGMMLMCSCAAGTAQYQKDQPSLHMDRQVYHPGNTIVVHFTAPTSYADNAWVGIIPADVPHGDEAVNDEHDLDYEYLHGRAAGELHFAAPKVPGRYDVRMNDTDDNGREVASETFTVE